MISSVMRAFKLQVNLSRAWFAEGEWKTVTAIGDFAFYEVPELQTVICVHSNM